MRYRKLTAAGDYTLGRTSEFWVNVPEAVAQAVTTALLLHEGEWFLDQTVGMPWETQVLGYGTASLYDAAIKNLILGVQGVQAIISYASSLNPQTRLLTVTATLNTIYGVITISAPAGTAPGGYGISPFGPPTAFGSE